MITISIKNNKKKLPCHNHFYKKKKKRNNKISSLFQISSKIFNIVTKINRINTEQNQNQIQIKVKNQ